MTTPKINRQAYRDALAYLYAKLTADQDGMRAVATGCEDPVGMVDAIADMSLGLASIATTNQPRLWLDKLRDDLDPLLDAYDSRTEDGGTDAP
ncbi:hypothetical protein QEN35_13010 [Gordonia alkanivorans]|uniref:hypothetical protein n=1 Tax=Gordonia TaxID=2053 RepID=UPI0012BB2EF9|nr:MULTISPECIES: hypothetical protein [Gordonia]MDH3025306.1 hypothetical protein [Gordonia alkanivorans]QGP87289.1 hypothetical protein GKZ92_06320 [Gordonia sp. 135]